MLATREEVELILWELGRGYGPVIYFDATSVAGLVRVSRRINARCFESNINVLNIKMTEADKRRGGLPTHPPPPRNSKEKKKEMMKRVPGRKLADTTISGKLRMEHQSESGQCSVGEGYR